MIRRELDRGNSRMSDLLWRNRAPAMDSHPADELCRWRDSCFSEDRTWEDIFCEGS